MKRNETTQIMQQYHDLKSKHPEAVLLFRCGDFYAAYNLDAKVCAEILGITFTWCNNEERHDLETCEGAQAGFPYHALDTYLPKLIRAGKRVAICDPLEDPKQNNRIKKKSITELVSPNESN